MPFSIVDDITPVSDDYPVISLGHDVNNPDPENGFILVEYLDSIHYYELRVGANEVEVEFVQEEYKDKGGFVRAMEGRKCYIQSVSTIKVEEEERGKIIKIIRDAGASATPTAYYRFRPPSWCESLSGQGLTQDDIEKQTAFEWARGKLIDCMGQSWSNKVAGGSPHLKRIATPKQFRYSSFIQCTSGSSEFKEKKDEEKQVITGKTYALVDVDETLIRDVHTYIQNVDQGLSDECLNMDLINALLQSGVTDLYLFTAMRLGEQNLQERQALISTLERKGFKVHGLITSADYVWPYLTEEEMQEFDKCDNQKARNELIDRLAAKITKETAETNVRVSSSITLEKKSSSASVDIAYNSIASQLNSLDSKDSYDTSQPYNDIGSIPIPEGKSQKGKIYLDIREDGVAYEAVDIEGERKKGVILRNNLPDDFPKGYRLCVISDESKTVIKSGGVYLSNKDCYIAYSVITPSGETVYNVPTQLKAPEPFDLDKLNLVEKEILDITSQARHTHSLSNALKPKEKWLPILSRQILRKQVLLQHEKKSNLAIAITHKLEADHDKLKSGSGFNHKGLLYKRFKQYLPPDLGRCLVCDDRQDVLDSVQKIEEEEKQLGHIPLTTIKVNIRSDRPPVDTLDTYLDAIHFHNNPHRKTGRDSIQTQISEYQRSVRGCTWFVPHVNRKRQKLKALLRIKDEMSTYPTQTPQECFEKVYRTYYAEDSALWQEIMKGTQTKALIGKFTLLGSSPFIPIAQSLSKKK